MKTLADLCMPKASVFDKVRLDTVYNLDDLSSMHPDEFLSENYVTEVRILPDGVTIASYPGPDRSIDLKDLITRGLVEYTIPEKPQSRLQRYRLTANGKEWLTRSWSESGLQDRIE